MRTKIAVFLCITILMFCTVLYGETKPTFIVHEPQGTTMEIVDFTPQLINYQSNIKYPAKWYVREETAGAPSLFITREPLKETIDRYKVGASIYYRMSYFISQEPPNSEMRKTAKAVLKVIDWEKDKQRNIEFWKNEGQTVVAHSDISISSQPALRIEHEAKNYRAITIYIKAGIHLIVMTFEAPPQEFESYRDTFEEMIKAFSFKKEFQIIDEATVLEAKTKEAMSK